VVIFNKCQTKIGLLAVVPDTAGFLLFNSRYLFLYAAAELLT
jgi:hypothetical protein